MADVTTQDLQRAIAEAIKERDFHGVRALLILLAKRDPKAAEETLEVINLGMAVAAQRDGSMCADPSGIDGSGSGS